MNIVNIKSAENVWTFDPFQETRIYKFRLKGTDEVVRGRYICEKTKSQNVPPPDREYEFLVDGTKRVFKASEIMDAQYSGI
jgi:hypothetical protein